MNLTLTFRILVSILLLTSTVRAFAQAPNANAGNDVTICANAQTTLSGSASGGQGPYQYSWAPATGLNNANISNPVCTVNNTTTYTLTVTGANNLTGTDQVTVTVNPAPTADLVVQSPAVETVFGGLSTFSLCDPALSWNFNISDESTGAGGSTLSINWGDGSPIYTPGAAGWSTNHTYAQGLWVLTYTITPANGCVDTEQFQVFLGTNPGGGISTDPNTNICTGGSLPFYLNNVSSNSPGTTYLIQFGDGTSVTLNHPPPAVVNHQYDLSSCPGGSYTVLFTAQNPCDQTNGQISPVRVSQTPVVDFSMSPNDTACVNTTVTFTDASLGFQAPTCTEPKNLWSISPGTYTVVSGTLGSANGQPTNPGLWTTGSNTLNVQFNQPGTYTITDVTGNVCGFDTLSRTICVEAPPTPSFTLATLPACAGAVLNTDNTSIALNTCSIRYQWTATWLSAPCNGPGSANILPNSTAFEPTIGFPVAGTYSVSLQAINSCNVPPVSQNVVIGSPPTVSLYTVGPICEGDNLYPTISAQNPCGLPITSTTWSTPNGSTTTFSGNPHPGLSYPNAVNTTVSVTVVNACGQGTASTPLIVNDTPPNVAATALQDTLCPGATLNLQANNVAGVQYVWSGPGFSSFIEDPVINNVGEPNEGTYTVTPYIGTCDGPPSSVNVVVLPGPVLGITASDQNICAGDQLTLTATGGSGYSWTANGNPIPGGTTIQVSPTSTTTYGITGVGSGCSGSASLTVTVNTSSPVVTTPTALYCDQAIPEFLTANPTGGTWSGADLVNLTAGGQVTPIAGNIGVDTLFYTYINANGCATVAQTIVTIQNETPAQAGNDVNACEGDPVIALAGAPAGGTWSGGAPWLSGNSFNPGGSGTFNLTYAQGSGSCATQDVRVITVTDTPNVVINGFTLCSNEPIYQLPNGVPAGGVWSGTGVSGAGPYNFDPAVGTQTLTYTVTVNTCTGSGSVVANVLPPPVANAGIDTTLCDQSIPFPLVANYGNAGTWSGGAPYLTQNPAQFTPAPNAVGTWTLTYSYTQGNCTDTDQVVITVVPLTITANAGNDTSICINAGSVQLGAAPAQGSWTPTAYLSAAGAFDPVIAGVGVHTAEFCVGAGTCRDCDQRSVTVEPPPTLNISPSTGVCVYEPVLDLFEGPTGGTWSGSTGITDAALGLFDPGQASLGDNLLTYTYTDPNTNCTNTAQLTITVSQQPVAAFTNPPIACQFADFTFTDQSSSDVSQWAWYPGDNTGPYSGQNFTYAYQDTGTYTVTLIAGTGNCTDTITGSVTVWPAPVIDLSLDTTQGCGPRTVNFQNNSTGPGVQYTWDFDLGSGSSLQFPPPLDYPAGVLDDTTYVITLSGTNLCGTFSDQATVTVFPTPTAYFGPDFDSGCSPWPVNFSNVSVGHADTFEWNWGDGTPNTFTNDSLVMHTFLTDSIPVVRTITLTATNACGVDTATYDVLVLPNTITAFFNTDTTQGCAPLTVNFTQYSIGVTNWNWDFGDNNFSTAYSTTHTYPDPGTYIATLFGDNGCSYDTVSVTITVEPSPVVNFSFAPDPVCSNGPVQFTNLTSDIAGVTWTFGDGDTSDLTDPQHLYATAGTYQVTLFVESTLNECTASVTQPVTISPVPVAAFTVSDSIFCAPEQVTFDNTSTGTNMGSTWTLDGTPFSYQMEPLPLNVPAAGSYVVELFIVDQLTGCADSTSRVIVGNPTPTASFSMQPVDVCGEPPIIEATSSSTNGALVQWLLDGQVIGAMPSLQYPVSTAGDHTLVLIAELPGSCRDSSVVDFTTYLLPTADFTADTACIGQSIQLTDQSTDFQGMWWYFNGVFVSTDPNTAAMIPTSLGTDTIALSVMGEGGCMDSTWRVVNVYAAPPADLLAEPLGDCTTLELDPVYVTPYASYLWTVNGLPYSQDLSAYYFYDPQTVAAIPVSLTVTSVDGCTVTTNVPVDVPSCVFVPNSFTPDGDGINDLFWASIVPFDRFRSLVIYDRWGQEIVTLDRDRRTWDGTKNGEQVQIGVYNWVLLIRGEESEPKRGHITLLR